MKKIVTRYKMMLDLQELYRSLKETKKIQIKEQHLPSTICNSQQIEGSTELATELTGT